MNLLKQGVCVLFVFYAGMAFAQRDSVLQKHIDYQVMLLDQCSCWDDEVEKDLWETSVGGEVKAFYKNDSLAKIEPELCNRNRHEDLKRKKSGSFISIA